MTSGRTDLPPLIAAMQRPAFYPHRLAEVSLAQSHISYVLLAGDAVYKVKKPVRFSFLDFSTLERRRHFCHEEVRLNRRLAANVYHGVVAICREGDDFRLGDEGDPAAVEYAVHMARLPADRMLDHLLDRNAVTPEMIDAVAVRLADFHRVADAGPQVSANGSPAAIWRVLEDNYTGVRPFRDVTITAADDDAIHAFSRSFLHTHAARLQRRQAEHRIRDCHGDLHSEHVCFTEPLVIFDCIEFNTEFRYCDVASEVAFLAMDLDYHERSELAGHLIARYAGYAADRELPWLVPFYQCYRAYVRGKVDSLKSAEAEVSDAERAEAAASARRHFVLAYRYTWAYRPCLVAIAGLSGTGKSVVAAALYERTGYRHINSDVVRKRLAGVPTATSASGEYAAGLYTAEMSAATYRDMLAEAAEQLGHGRGAILDATFQRRADRDAVQRLAAEHGIPFLLVECRCDEQEIRRRLDERARRRDTPSDADWKVYLEQRRRSERFGSDETERVVIDTAVAVSELTPVIERALRSSSPGATAR